MIICKHKQAYISTTIYQDTIEKILKDIFCICNFGRVPATQGVICHPRKKKSVAKL